MPDIELVKQWVKAPATLQIGGTAASEISGIIFGAATFTFQAALTATGGSASATGAIAGLTSAFSIIPCLTAQMATGAGTRIEAIIAGAGVATATAVNAASAAQTLGAASINFFAFS